MDKRPLIITLSMFLLVVLAGGVLLAGGQRPNLGLDLQGGISAVYEPVLNEGGELPEDFEEIIDEAIEVIRARVDSLGVAEPDISRSGTDVLVQLPGVTDAERLQQLIGRTAQLRFRPVDRILVPGDPDYDQGVDCTAPVDERADIPAEEAGILCGADGGGVFDPVAERMVPLKYEVGPAGLTGERIEDAFPVLADAQGYAVSLQFDRVGGEAFAALSADLACQRDVGLPGLLAIVLDGVVESAPNMSSSVACGIGIRDGAAQITVGAGSLAEQEEQARDLALVLRTGALPITLEPSTFEQVSATLGAESLRAGLLAGLIGLALVGGWLIWFYRQLGVVALASLGMFAVLIVSLITLLGRIGFALTLAGVAGLIVAVGITADSSIIFFERIRDEVNLGKTVRTAVRRAYSSAFRTNLAGNTVTLAAAVVLYFLAVGPVRGFALMLGIATVLDILILWAFTRPVVWLMSETRLLTRHTVRAADTAVAPGGAR
ncbi:MAG: protein translocase subunit SecD [Nitriliruptoraceae bacterium]